jgi:DNA-nicking Smr family endonuclease
VTPRRPPPDELDPEPVEIPIDGVLDLHTFHPRDLGRLIPEYLAACRERGLLEVRIIHGKGKGTLRRTVHSLLEREKTVLRFAPAGPEAGGWGATLVFFAPQWPR